MNEALKLFSLNIERGKHYDRWIPFVQKNDFDVICLQEVYKSDIAMFEERLGCQMYFAPMGNIFRDSSDKEEVVGVAMGFFIDHKKPLFDYYTDPYNPADFFGGPKSFQICPRVLLCGLCIKNGKDFFISTTHFTWTPDGHMNDCQKKDLRSFLRMLENYDDIVFCGDMNAPRGRITFDTIAKKYIDHIPKHYTTSIDSGLHLAGDLQLMVDALFSTPDYIAENVELVSGLSDHMGIVADIYHQ